jgi:hypothetical protein
MNGPLEKYAPLFGKTGTWCTVLADAGTGTVVSQESVDVRPAQVADALRAAGAEDADARAAEEALRPEEGLPSPVARLLLVRNGTVELDRVLPGERVENPYISVGVIPDLLPLVRHEGSDLPVITANVDRSGADIVLSYARPGMEGRQATEEHTTEGSTENLKKVPGGGWAQGKYQHRTEEIWRQNADEVAGEIDRLVEARRPALVAIGGDQRARDLVFSQLSDHSRAIAATVDSHTRAAGADPEVMTAAVERLLAEKQAHAQHQLLERLEQEKDHPNPRAVFGIGAVVRALQQAQVETLVLSDQLAPDPGAGNTATDQGGRQTRELVVLDEAPWIAAAEDEVAGARVLGRAAAAAALLRAAVLTDATVELLPAAAIPGGAEAAGVLRWGAGQA